MTVAHSAGTLAPTAGLAIFTGHVLATFAVVAILLKHRDA